MGLTTTPTPGILGRFLGFPSKVEGNPSPKAMFPVVKPHYWRPGRPGGARRGARRGAFGRVDVGLGTGRVVNLPSRSPRR